VGCALPDIQVVNHDERDDRYTKYWGSSQNGKDYLEAPSMDGF
jgi:hypothetical protein